VELEALVEPFAHEVEFGAVDVGQALGIDQHFHAMVFEHRVLGCHVVGVLELVGQARTAGGANAQTHAHALATLADVAGDVPCCGFSESDSHGFSARRQRAHHPVCPCVCSRIPQVLKCQQQVMQRQFGL